MSQRAQVREIQDVKGDEMEQRRIITASDVRSVSISISRVNAYLSTPPGASQTPTISFKL